MSEEQYLGERFAHERLKLQLIGMRDNAYGTEKSALRRAVKRIESLEKTLSTIINSATKQLG